MKRILLFFFLCFGVFSLTNGQTKKLPEKVVITSNKNKTQVSSGENGELVINVSKKEVRELKKNGVVRYSDFGAKGDGKTDDIDAIAAAHAFANQHGIPVKEQLTTLAGKTARQLSKPIPTSAPLRLSSTIPMLKIGMPMFLW